MVIGAVAGIVCCFACGLKFKLGYDDSLDVVGVHGVGGLIGTLLIGLFGEGTGLLAGGDLASAGGPAAGGAGGHRILRGGDGDHRVRAGEDDRLARDRIPGDRRHRPGDQGERAYDFAGTASSVLKEVK